MIVLAVITLIVGAEVTLLVLRYKEMREEALSYKKKFFKAQLELLYTESDLADCQVKLVEALEECERLQMRDHE